MLNLIKRKINNLIDERIEDLENRVFNKKSESSTYSTIMDHYYSLSNFGYSYSQKTLEDRIDGLEEKMNLLLDKLGLEKRNISEKTVLRTVKKKRK